MKISKVLACTILFAVVITACQGQSAQPQAVEPAATVSPPTTTAAHEPSPSQYWPGAEWEPAIPEQQGMDSGKLAEMLAYVQEKGIRMHSFVVARNGRLVLEAYFDPYTADTHHQIASITKSVMGALVGIAIEQGKIKSVQQPVVDFFPGRSIANLDERKRSMTLEDLLTLAPGLDCSDADGTEAQMTNSPDWVQFVLDLPMKADPGKQWTYCSSAVHLVSAILQQATAMDARSYANQYLFKPIGIAAVPPERWPTDSQGISTGGNGLFLTPTEVARFATLYLNGGKWGDQQVVPETWVRQSTTAHVTVGKMKEYGDMNRSYGYLWSIYPEQQFYSALGRNGQHIHVFPEENMVVVFTSATSLFSDEHQFALLKDYILPAVKSGAAIPENPDAAAALKAQIDQAASPRQPVGPLPEAANALNGKTIHIDTNPFGWQRMVLNFEDGAEIATIQLDNQPQITLGMDNTYRLQEMPGAGQVGFKGTWDAAKNQFIIHQVFIGTWIELEISLTLKGEDVTIFQRNTVDGGNLVRITGRVE